MEYLKDISHKIETAEGVGELADLANHLSETYTILDRLVASLRDKPTRSDEAYYAVACALDEWQSEVEVLETMALDYIKLEEDAARDLEEFGSEKDQVILDYYRGQL